MRIKKLTDAQKGAVIHEWTSRPANPPSLQELIAAAGYEGKDGRTKEVLSQSSGRVDVVAYARAEPI